MADERGGMGGGPGTDAGDVQIRTFLIADVRGYTLFTQERGDEAAAKLAARFADTAREHVEARGGTLLELRGDEALCVFASAREAIRAAVELQERFVEQTQDDPSLPLTVGIGLDAGEAVPVQGGYRGGALNLAARLCGQARAGEILASREVTHLARRLDGVRYEDRGSLTFKGISDPVAVVRVLPEGADPVERLRPYAPAAPAGPKASGRRWPLLVGIAVLLVALVAVTIPLLSSDGGGPVTIASNSAARMDPGDGSVGLTAPLGERPGASATGFGSLWVAHPDRGFVSRVNLEGGSVQDTIPVGASPAGITTGDGSVWVTNADDGTVSRIDVDTNTVTQELVAGTGPTGIAFGDGALWIADTVGVALLRLEPASGELHAIPLSGRPSDVWFSRDEVWVSLEPNGLARIDPASMTVTLTQTVGNGPSAVLRAFGSVWVANSLDATVSRLHPSTGSIESVIAVAEGPGALAADGERIWVGNELDDSITAIDPASNGAELRVSVGAAPTSLAVAGDGLWLLVAASATEHRGGTLSVSSPGVGALDSLDPAAAVHELAWSILSITNDGLLAFRKVGGPDGATLVPDLAAALPQISGDGLTYRFPLREGIVYSTGEPVLAEDFRHAIERTVAMGSDWSYLYDALVGARRCSKDPEACDLSEAIVAEGAIVTFHLERPDPDLPFKLALPPAFPVPASTPVADQGLDPVPATGPYLVAEADERTIELARNPTFREWSGVAQPDGFVDAISWRFDEDHDAAFDRVDAGELDWMTEAPRPPDLAQILAAHPAQVVRSQDPATMYVGYLVQEPPFDDPRVRQALNLAIDRDRVTELFGGTEEFRPTCQILPPGFQGYEPFCPFTLDPEAGVWSAPDLDRARGLIRSAGALGDEITAWVGSFDLAGAQDVMRYIVQVLNDLGFQADLKVIDDPGAYAGGIYAGEAQMFMFGWFAGFPSAGDFIPTQFLCGSPANSTGFCDERVDAAIEEAQRLQGTDPAAATAAWTAIEHGLVEEAVWAPLVNLVSPSVFSARTRNIQDHPQWGILLSRIWVQ